MIGARASGFGASFLSADVLANISSTNVSSADKITSESLDTAFDKFVATFSSSESNDQDNRLKTPLNSEHLNRLK